MKKTIAVLLALLLCCACAGGTLAEEQASDTELYSPGMGFVTRIPKGCPVEYHDDGSFIVYAKKRGYVPYVEIIRRNGQLSSPVNYLNNLYREYMEEKYDNRVGTNPARETEIGGKTLYMAQYHYTAGENQLVLMLCIERRTDGDVEYHAKFQEGRQSDIDGILDALVRNYTLRPEEAGLPETTGRVITPLPLPADVDAGNGEFRIGLEDLNQIVPSGYFTAALYLQDRYRAEDIESLQAGDQVTVNGTALTVTRVVTHQEKENYEIYTAEDVFEYCAFWRAEEDGTYLALVDDWTPCTLVARQKITLPLPDAAVFYSVPGGDDPKREDTDEFLARLSEYEGKDYYNPYNTWGTLKDGVLTEVYSASYPYGPEGEGE